MSYQTQSYQPLLMNFEEAAELSKALGTDSLLGNALARDIKQTDAYMAEVGIEVPGHGEGGGCQSGMRCLTHSLWSDLSVRIEEFLNSISLAELVADADVQSVATRQDKHVKRVIEQLDNIQVSCQL